jgi:hypothetical protein
MDYPNALLRARLGPDWMPTLEQRSPGADHFRSGLCRFVERFPMEIICHDCNTADGAVKQHIQADRYFFPSRHLKSRTSYRRLIPRIASTGESP